MFSHASASEMNAWLSFCALPAFFIISGFLLNLDKWGKSGAFFPFVAKLAKRLLMPFYVAEFLFYPLWLIVTSLPLPIYPVLNPTLSAGDAFCGIFLGVGSNLPLPPLWFLPCLFAAEVIFLALYKILGERRKIFFAAIILCSMLGIALSEHGALPLNLDLALASQMFLLAGNLIARRNLVDRLNIFAFIILVDAIALAVSLNDPIDMNRRLFGQYVIPAFLACLAETLLLFKFSQLVTTAGGLLAKPIIFCGKQSLFVLTVHVPIIVFLYQMIHLLTGLLWTEIIKLPEIFVPTVLFTLSLSLWLAKRFGKQPVFKYFCV